MRSLGLVFAHVGGPGPERGTILIHPGDTSVHLSQISVAGGALGHPLWQGPGFRFLGMGAITWCHR